MPRGPRPKPTHLHLIEGTVNVTRHRRRLQSEPKPQGELREPPDWFTPEQAEVWAYGLKHAPRGMLKSLDASVYRVWCIACATHQQAASRLARLGTDGLIIRTSAKPGPPGPDGKPTLIGGNVIQNPLVGVLNRQALLLLRAAEQLGFSPSARARVSMAEGGGAPHDPEDEFLA